MMFDINEIMKELSRCRPIFHSESDFQKSLARHIYEKFNHRVQLELKPFQDKKLYLDIWYSERRVAIELKYKSKEVFNYLHNDESFTLASQDARDLARYDFIKDISRLEDVVIDSETKATAGFAVFLTNDPLYWDSESQPRNIPEDVHFRIHKGRTLECNKVLDWTCKASEKIKKGRDRVNPISLKNNYSIVWKNFSSLKNCKYSLFKYLVVSV